MASFLKRIHLRYQQSGLFGVYWRLILFISEVLGRIYTKKTKNFPSNFLSFILNYEIQPPNKILGWLKKELLISNSVNLLLKNEQDTYIQTHPKEKATFYPAKTLPGWTKALPQTTISYTHPAHNIFLLHNARVIGYEGITITNKGSIFREGYPWSLREQYERAICESILSRNKTYLAGTLIHGIDLL